MQAVLVMFRSDGERRSFSITREVTVIGRREDCDLRIPLGDISRKHARLIKEDGQIRLEDLGSSNGTYLNGQRIEREAYLQAGDSIQVGPVVFVLQVDGYPGDEELQPVTAETAAAAAMFAPAAAAGAGAELEDPTLDLGGYAPAGGELGGELEELPAEFADDGNFAPEGELEPLEEIGGASEGQADEFEPLPLDDAPLELEDAPLGEDALELTDDDVPAAAPMAQAPLPMATDDEPLALSDEPLSLEGEEPLALEPEEPIALEGEEPLALEGEEPLALEGEEPLALEGEEPLALEGDELGLAEEQPLELAEGDLELLEEPPAEGLAEDELMIDFEEPEKK